MLESKIRVGCELLYEVKAPSSFMFNIVVAPNEHQRVVTENLQLDPNLLVTRSEIGGGNQVQRVSSDVGTLKLSYTADVEVQAVSNQTPQIDENRYAEVPSDVLTYLNPSRYCESDRLAEFARQQFGAISPGYQRVQSICDWTNGFLNYSPGSTDGLTTACDVLIGRNGVCRDFAHLSIAMCRALGIPARYVASYAVDIQPPDFHGLFEAYLDDRWYLFDPSRLAETSGLVRIATGRDAADTPFATIVGHAILQNKTVWTEVLNGSINDVDEPKVGVSTA